MKKGERDARLARHWVHCRPRSRRGRFWRAPVCGPRSARDAMVEAAPGEPGRDAPWRQGRGWPTSVRIPSLRPIGL